MGIASDQIKTACKISDTALSIYINPLNKTLEKYDINSKQRIAAFLSQIIVESGSFKYTSENLNYSVEGLLKTFPKHFNSKTAEEYARKPEKIANKVYADRYGNGSEASGDGWRYRGRGFIQITFKYNYETAAKSFDMPLNDFIDYVETPEGCCMSAGYFWNEKNLNSLADEGNILGITKKVTGSLIGLEDRVKYFKALKEVLQN